MVSWADALEAIAGALGVVLTAGTLIYAVRSSRESNEMARRALHESVVNRKDDMIPVLTLNHRPQNSSNDTNLTFYLKNVGNGPIFNLKVVEPKENSGVRYEPEINNERDGYYYIICSKAELQSLKQKRIKYEYQDLYGRTFWTSQTYEDHGGNQFQIHGDFTIPKKIKE